MGRNKNPASRRSRAERRKAEKAKAPVTDATPSDRILALRSQWSFVQPPAKDRLDGRNGEIDSEICDDIGKLCALGLFDGHGHDPIEMRDKGRFWGCHYAKLLKASGVKMGSYERASKGTPSHALTKDDLMFDRMDEDLWNWRVVDGVRRGTPTFECEVLQSLVVDPLIGHEEVTTWTQGLIAEGLRERGRPAQGHPTLHDRELLAAAVRGLVILIDGALPQRWAQERSAA